MSSRSETALLLIPAACLAVYVAARQGLVKAALAHTTPALRVCADPNNLPFSDSTGGGSGFENRIAQLVAADLGMHVQYTWWPQRRGFVRNTLKAGTCDVVIGVPTSYDMTMVTRPYYRSTYVFVTRSDRDLDIRSFDDPRLGDLRIGIHLMGDDYANSPAALSLMRRGAAKHLVGYMIYGDYSKPHPPSELIDAVARGDVDVAIAWGPLAGYFAKHARVPLRLHAVSPQIEVPFVTFVYDVAMGVRRGDTARRDVLNREIERRAPEIARILEQYGIPVLRVAGVGAGIAGEEP